MSALARILGFRHRFPAAPQLLDHRGRSLSDANPAIVVSVRHTRLRAEPIVPPVDVKLGKRALRAAQMLNEAQAWADALTLAEMTDPAEPLEDVWHRLERKTGVSYGTFWSLRYRYRQLKDIWGSVYSLLREAHEQREDKHLRRQKHGDDIARITRRRGET